MANNGLLLVIAEPPAPIEEEYNAWVDTEHFPERLAIKGFLGGRRFVSCERVRRYLVLYDLTEVGVLHSEGYLAHTGDNLTPWSRRIVARHRTTRLEASQIFPGDAALMPAPRELLVKFEGLDGPAARFLRDWIVDDVTAARAVVQRRLFEVTRPGGESYLVIISGAGGLEQLLDVATLGPAARCITLMETFAPY